MDLVNGTLHLLFNITFIMYELVCFMCIYDDDLYEIILHIAYICMNIFTYDMCVTICTWLVNMLIKCNVYCDGKYMFMNL